MRTTGYPTEIYVIELAAVAIFEFVEPSGVNANPKNTEEHTEGVWTLLPEFRLK